MLWYIRESTHNHHSTWLADNGQPWAAAASQSSRVGRERDVLRLYVQDNGAGHTRVLTLRTRKNKGSATGFLSQRILNPRDQLNDGTIQQKQLSRIHPSTCDDELRNTLEDVYCCDDRVPCESSKGCCTK